MLKSRKSLVDSLINTAKRCNALDRRGGLSPFNGYHLLNGKYAFTDGYRVYLLNEDAGYAPAPYLPLEDAIRMHHTPQFNAGKRPLHEYDEAFNHFNVDVDVLRAFVVDKGNKYRSKAPVPYPLFTGKGTIYVNARYLLDAIELIQHDALKTTRVVEVYNDGDTLHAIWVYNTNGEAAAVLPCRVVAAT